MPLRRLLPMVTAALVALALLIAGVIAVIAMRDYLILQVDTRLTQSPAAASAPPPPPPTGDSPLSSDLFIQVSDDSGAVVARISNLPADLTAPDLPSMTRSEVVATGAQPFTAHGWRVLARPTPTGTVMVAQSLSDVNATVRRLVWLEAAVGLAVAALVAALSATLVRRSLRPLRTVEQTAVAITRGDVSQRIQDPRAGTEAGDVAVALNTMLDRLQQSLDQRQAALDSAHASQARLRQFVADASHELRTPLTTVRGTAELFRQGAIPAPDVPAAFARIETESQRMGRLVDELLLLARLDEQPPLDLGPVDLLTVCTQAVGTRSDQQVVLRIDPGLTAPIVMGDQMRLRQVVDNLIGNGLQHGAGTVTVTVRTTEAEAVIDVTDEGPGVSVDEATRVFDRFYRSAEHRSRATGGSGLGLSIVKALVEAHRGTVAVSGSTFTVTLPLAR